MAEEETTAEENKRLKFEGLGRGSEQGGKSWYFLIW
jgi:hypothetical protein